MTNRAASAHLVAEAIQAAVDYRGWSQGRLAEIWGVSQGLVSMLVNGHRSITPLVALRMEATFGGTAEAWMDLQRDHDLAKARREMAVELREIRRRARRAR